MALREKKSESSPLQGGTMTPRGYCWGRHLRPSTEGPRSIRIQRQGLLLAQRLKRRRRQVKRSEDQGADSEDEGKRRKAKTKAPTAKTKASEERRRPKRQRRSRRQQGDSARVDGGAKRGAAKKGVRERARRMPRRPNSPNDDMCLGPVGSRGQNVIY